MKTLFLQQFWLVLSVVAVTLLLLFPVSNRFGTAGVEGLLAAAAICLAPGCIVLLIPVLMQRSSVVGLAALAALAAGLLRMLFVLAGLLAVMTLRPDIPPMVFGACVVVLYLVSLCIETWLVVRSLR